MIIIGQENLPEMRLIRNISGKILLMLFIIIVSSCSKGEEVEIDDDDSFRIDVLLPDTDQLRSYTSTTGEDADFIINQPSFTDNGNGTVTDNVTGLMWQKTDGGEMTIESAVSYCESLSLGGFSDWRLPGIHELFCLNSYDKVNPALNLTYFPQTTAEYWWSSDKRTDNQSYVWVVNAGGGAGPHPKEESLSAGGTKHYHVRAVRNNSNEILTTARFTDNGDGTITDNMTLLIWQKIHPSQTMTWEEALVYASGLSLAGKSDWRLPNIKELQSLNDEGLMKPSFNKVYFTNVSAGNFWSSTTLVNAPVRAWDINLDYGIVSYNDKSLKEYVLCVR